MIARHRRSIISLLESLKALVAMPGNTTLLLDLQLRLARKIVQIERRVREARTTMKTRKAELRAGRVSKAESQRRRRRAEQAEQRYQSYRSLLSRLRSIGDGIAFIYFDRWDIKPLTRREASGYM